MEWNFLAVQKAFEDAVDCSLHPTFGLSDASFDYSYGAENGTFPATDFESPKIKDVIIDVPGYPIPDSEQNIETLAELIEIVMDCILGDIETPEDFGLKIEVQEKPGKVIFTPEWTWI